MLGDGNINVIRDEDGDLFINMWQLTQHLVNSANMMDQMAGEAGYLISDTFRVLAVTLCDLALYEMGMDALETIDDVNALMNLWHDNRE